MLKYSQKQNHLAFKIPQHNHFQLYSDEKKNNSQINANAFHEVCTQDEQSTETEKDHKSIRISISLSLCSSEFNSIYLCVFLQTFFENIFQTSDKTTSKEEEEKKAKTMVRILLQSF